MNCFLALDNFNGLIDRLVSLYKSTLSYKGIPCFFSLKIVQVQKGRNFMVKMSSPASFGLLAITVMTPYLFARQPHLQNEMTVRFHAFHWTQCWTILWISDKSVHTIQWRDLINKCTFLETKWQQIFLAHLRAYLIGKLIVINWVLTLEWVNFFFHIWGKSYIKRLMVVSKRSLFSLVEKLLQ